MARSILPDLYRDGRATPGGNPHDIANGEFSVLEQYLAALDAAQSSIYMEHQILLCPKLMLRLRSALERGIEVAVLVPRITMPEVVRAREHPKGAPLFELLGSLGEFENFTFAAIVANREPGQYEDVYVHAKYASIDDAWTTVGSTNAMVRSFKGDTEMNASFWDAEISRALRCELLHEQLGEETEHLDGRVALRRYREIALANRDRYAQGEPLQGQVLALDPAEWAT